MSLKTDRDIYHPQLEFGSGFGKGLSRGRGMEKLCMKALWNFVLICPRRIFHVSEKDDVQSCKQGVVEFLTIVSVNLGIEVTYSFKKVLLEKCK